MKRDMDLVRRILFRMEESPSGWAPSPFKIEGYSEEQVGYHVMLMAEAGLLMGHDVTAGGDHAPNWLPGHLTWSGHEFLEAARNDNTWNKAKAAVGTVAGLSLEVLKNVLVNYGTSEAMRLIRS